ncbi:MAG TPA: succinate dehydrogenase [Candidatus Dormibacteraeota bacterium]
MALSETATEAGAAVRQAVENPYSALPNWLYPTFVVTVLTLFGLFAAYVVFLQPAGYFAPYLSPFDSPRISVGPIPPGVWVAWAPLVFRLTCYYYRKAYFRSFFWHPRSCAVPEPKRGRYRGETAFPWILNNFHRFAFYATVVQVVFLWIDAVLAFDFNGRFGVGFGSALMLLNVLLLSGYTFGCHAFRHLAGGQLDCFSCSLATRARFRLWKGVTVLNIRHDRWAWASLVSVAATDIYIRLLMHGWLTDLRWIS